MIRTIFLTTAFTALAMSANAQSEPVGQTVAVNGMDLYYEVSGAGDPVIVLHGAYMTIPAMGELIPMLAETHEVYALEFQGHGRTNDIDRPITYPNLADDVAAFMDAIGLERADIVGYSMGGGAGLQLAIRHPERVDHLALVSGASFSAEGFQPAFAEMIPQMTREMFVGTPMEDAWRELAVDPEGFPDLVDKMIALEHEPLEWREEVAALDLPILIVSGDHDVVTLEHTVDFFRLLGGGEMGDMGIPLPDVRLAVLPASSHTAVINQPQLLHLLIEPFLADETPEGMM